MIVRRLVVLLGASTVLWSGTGVGLAQADPAARIRGVTDVGGRLEIVLSGSGLAETSLDPTSVSVTLEGQPVQASAQLLGGVPSSSLVRRVVLLLDASGSMAGPGIFGAKQAAQAFLGSAPRDVEVGLVVFSDTARLLVSPTRDRGVVSRAIATLVAKGETALYDGVRTAVQALGAGGLRNVVLLSDGADTVSRTSLTDLLTQLKASGAQLDSVAFRTRDTAGSVLQQMASATAGRVLGAANVGDLAQAFRQAAASLTNQLVVTAEVPTALAGRQATVVVSLRGGGKTLTDQVVTVLPAKLAVASQHPVAHTLHPLDVSGLARSNGTLAVGLGGLFAAIVLIVLLATSRGTSKQRAGSRQRRLLALYTLTGRPKPVKEETSVIGDSQIAQSALELAGRFAARRGLEERLSLRLERAAVPVRPNEWLLIVVGLSVAGFVLLLLLSGNALGGVVGAVLGGAAPGRWLAFKAGRRQAAFEDALPDALQLLAGSMSAGFSLPQAIDAVAREGSEPISGEFGRAVAEARLGVPVEETLAGIAERMDSENFRWVTMAVRTQRDVGGNLAEVLVIVSQTMRDRAKLKRHVRALSAEGRLSAYVLLGLPVGMATYLFTFRRAYVHPLYTDVLGIIMLVGAGVLLGIGFLWMRNIIKVEV